MKTLSELHMNDSCRVADPGIVASWLGDVPDVERSAKKCSLSRCTWEAKTLKIEPDFNTLGVLVLYTKGVVTDWIDLIISDLALDSLTEQRIMELEAELGGPMAEYEVARRHVERGHAMILGSSSFTIIRLSRIGRQI